MVVALSILLALVVGFLICLAHSHYTVTKDLEGVRKAARDTAICVLNLQTRIHSLEAQVGNEDLSQLPQYRRVASS